MLKHRVIPVLLIKDGGLVKTERFKNPKYVGDPINAIRIFNEKEVDELIVLDINASKKQREPDYELISNFSSECFMPLCYGGGIKNMNQAKKIFALGVEKISVQSSAINNLNFISDLSHQFGNQSIVLSIDIIKSWTGKYKLFNSKESRASNINWKDILVKAVELGAGEIVINFVNRDGTRSGMEFNLYQEASNLVNVPIIACGGVGSLNDIKKAAKNGASAIAAGAFFVFLVHIKPF